MNDQQSSISQDLEHLFKKTTEANKLFLAESAKFVRQLSSSKIKGEELFTTQKQLFKDAVNLFVKLNIQHTSNLIDLGVAITKRLNQNLSARQNESSQQDFPDDNTPAFVLNASGVPGGTGARQRLGHRLRLRLTRAETAGRVGLCARRSCTSLAGRIATCAGSTRRARRGCLR